jgi:hypothetical protein
MTYEQAREQVNMARSHMQRSERLLRYERMELNICATPDERFEQVRSIDEAKVRFERAKIRYDKAMQQAIICKLSKLS